MAAKTFSISMDERAYRHVKAEADRAGMSVAAWIAKAAREKIQRDAATEVAELDQRTDDDWAIWSEHNESDTGKPGSGSSAA